MPSGPGKSGITARTSVFVVEQHDGRGVGRGQRSSSPRSSEGVQQPRVFAGRDRVGRHVKDQKIVLPADGQDTRFAGRKAELVPAHEGMARCKGGMAAQRDFGGRGEPPELVVGVVIFARDRERRFAEIILGRDGLDQPVIEPAFERQDRGRVSGQGRSAKASPGRRGCWSFRSLRDVCGSRVSRSVCPLRIDVDQYLGARKPLLQLLLDGIEPVVRFLHRPVGRDPDVELSEARRSRCFACEVVKALELGIFGAGGEECLSVILRPIRGPSAG